MKRLERFEDVFSELMVGFALAMLLAIGLAPNIFFNWDSAEKIKTQDFAVKSTKNVEQILLPGEWEFKEVNSQKTVSPDKLLIYTKKPFFELELGHLWIIPYPNSKKSVIFFLIALWIIKYLHESSVTKFYKSDSYLQLTKLGNILIFGSKVGFLIFLYYLIVSVYLLNAGNFTSLSLPAFVFFGYILPDFVLVFCSNSHQRTYTLFCSEIKNLPEGSVERAMMIWCREDIINIIYAVGMVIVSKLIQAETITPDLSMKIVPWITLGVLAINLADWGFNHKFFWDKQK